MKFIFEFICVPIFLNRGKVTLTNLNISHNYEKSSMKMTGSINANSLYLIRKFGCSIKILRMGIVFSRMICMLRDVPNWERIECWVKWTWLLDSRSEIWLSWCGCSGWLFARIRTRGCSCICRYARIQQDSRFFCLRTRSCLSGWGDTWKCFQNWWKMLGFQKDRNGLFSSLHEDCLHDSERIAFLLYLKLSFSDPIKEVVGYCCIFECEIYAVDLSIFCCTSLAIYLMSSSGGHGSWFPAATSS